MQMHQQQYPVHAQGVCLGKYGLREVVTALLYANLQASWPARLLQWCDSKMFGAFSFRNI